MNDAYIDKASRALALFSRDADGQLSKDEYAFLAEMGIIKTSGDYDGLFQASWQVVWLENMEVKNELISIGKRIKEQHWHEFEAMRAPYVKAVCCQFVRLFCTKHDKG